MLGLPIGLALALARVQPARIFSVPAGVYVEVVRGTPLLVQILFIYFVLPAFGVNLPAFTSGAIALTLNSARLPRRDLPRRHRVDRDRADGGGALARDDLRAGHAARDPAADVPPRPAAAHQRRASRCLKDSSLVSVIGLTELARTGQELASRYAAPLTIWPMVALLYLLLTFPLTRVAQELERRWRPVARG